MSWEDRDWNQDEGGFGGTGRPGGDWHGIRPSFDNPMTWSVPLGRWFAIDVRLHIIFLIYILIELFSAIWGAVDKGDAAPLGPFFTIVTLAGLFVIVLLHEYGHCLACRQVGGVANEILMWPLGGLAYCEPPNHWTAHFWTVAGGPLVNVGLMILMAIPLGIATGVWWGVAFPIPFVWPSTWWQNESDALLMGLYLVANVNVALLLFNLLPMFPLDGGRLTQSLLWPRLGYVRSMRYVVRAGYVAAIALGIFGAVMQQWMLVAIAIFGGFTCWQTYRQLQFTEEVMGFEYDEYALQLGREADHDEPAADVEPSKREQRKAQKLAEQRAKEEAELDRLLQKIAEGGLESLSAKERRWLNQHSRKKKQEKQ